MAVADDILSAQEHLSFGLLEAFLYLAQPLPRVFVEEAHRRVKGRAAPHLYRMVADFVHRLAYREHVVGTQARRHDRLVRVTERCLHNADARLCLCRGSFRFFVFRHDHLFGLYSLRRRLYGGSRTRGPRRYFGGDHFSVAVFDLFFYFNFGHNYLTPPSSSQPYACRISICRQWLFSLLRAAAQPLPGPSL